MSHDAMRAKGTNALKRRKHAIKRERDALKAEARLIDQELQRREHERGVRREHGHPTAKQIAKRQTAHLIAEGVGLTKRRYVQSSSLATLFTLPESPSDQVEVVQSTDRPDVVLVRRRYIGVVMGVTTGGEE